MKHRISLPLPMVFILAGALMLSLVFNYAQYDLANSPPKSPVMGTYQAGNTVAAVYLVFDDKGNFCRYTQQNGVLEEGVYLEDSPEQYTLTASNGHLCQAVRTREGIYFFNGREAVALYVKVDSALFFVGNHEWPDWAS